MYKIIKRWKHNKFMSTLSAILVVGDLSFTSQANAGVWNNKQKINRCVNALKLIVQYRVNVSKVLQISQFL